MKNGTLNFCCKQKRFYLFHLLYILKDNINFIVFELYVLLLCTHSKYYVHKVKTSVSFFTNARHNYFLKYHWCDTSVCKQQMMHINYQEEPDNQIPKHCRNQNNYARPKTTGFSISAKKHRSSYLLLTYIATVYMFIFIFTQETIAFNTRISVSSYIEIINATRRVFIKICA